MKRLIPLLMLAALGAAGWWYYSDTSQAAESAPTTVTVARGDITVSVLASGLVESTELVSVGARTSGQIETLTVSTGDEVSTGDLLAQIDSLDQQNAVAQAEADLQEIEAQIEAQQAQIQQAELALARQQRLSDQNVTTTADLETAQAELAVARATLSGLEAQKSRAEIAVTSAELDLERTRITAPMDGTVVAVVTREGQTVNAASDAPTIVKIAALDEMVITAEISEADVINVSPGLPVEFSLLGDPDHLYQAELASVEPAPASIKESDDINTDEAIYYNAHFTVSNPDRTLRIGMTADVTILLDRVENVLTLPAAALPTIAPDGTAQVEIYNPANGSRETRTITVGLQNAVSAEIVDGLEEGDQIVASTGSGANATVERDGPPGMF